MRKTKLINAKAADLTVFYDENDPQQYLVYSLKFGETVIGGNPDKSSLVLHFSSELDDAHAKITVEDEDYSIEDLGSHKGTFKIKSDNSLIRLKPFKSYDLAPQTAFYLGRFKQEKEFEKYARGEFQRERERFQEGMKKNDKSTKVNDGLFLNLIIRCIFRAAKTGRNDGLFSLSPLDGHSQRGKDNGLKRQVSYDDIEEDELFRKTKKGILQKLSKNQKESELIEEEEERKVPVSRVLLNKAVGQTVSKKEVLQSQKQFVKSKGQLPKVEENKDEGSVQLNQSFLKRIQEKLQNSQISKQKDLISEMGAKYSSQSQKKNQDLKSQVKEVAKDDEEEETWKPLKIKDSKKGSEKLDDKKKNKEVKVEEKKQTKIDKIIQDIMSTNLGQKIAKVKEQKARQQEEKQQNKAKLDGKVDEKVTELNGDTKGKEKKKDSKNQRTPDKSTINEKIQKILSNFASEKIDEEKEEIPVKEVKGKVITKQEKKDEKVPEIKKKEVSQKAVQNDEIKEQKGKSKKEQKIVEEKEEEMVFEKKSASKLNGKKNAPKSETNEDIPKKSAGKQKLEEGKAKEESPKKISSKKKAVLKADSSDDSAKKDVVLLGKRKSARREIEIVEEIPKKKVKGSDEKEQKGKVKSANTPKKDKAHGKSSSAAKRELAKLISDGNVIQEGARKGKLRVVFSNSCVDDLEREKLRLLGVKVVDDFESASEFDLLVTDQIVRRLKILVAINKAIPIISSDWVKEAIKQQTIIPFEPFIISKASKELSKQYSFDLSSSIIRQFDHPEGVLAGVAFSLPYPLDNISTQELRKLLLSAGASFSSSSSDADTYTITEASKKEQNEELLKLGVKLVSQEGILQSCLLQINVLDDYLIKKATVSSKKKTTKK